MKGLIVLTLLLAFVLWGSGCEVQNQLSNTPSNLSTDQSQALNQDPTQSPLPTASPEPRITQVTLGAVGDILLHNRVYEDARLPNGEYSFNKMFTQVKDMLHKPEIVIANQESITGGTELGLSSFPVFNSPH